MTPQQTTREIKLKEIYNKHAKVHGDENKDPFGELQKMITPEDKKIIEFINELWEAACSSSQVTGGTDGVWVNILDRMPGYSSEVKWRCSLLDMEETTLRTDVVMENYSHVASGLEWLDEAPTVQSHPSLTNEEIDNTSRPAASVEDSRFEMLLDTVKTAIAYRDWGVLNEYLKTSTPNSSQQTVFPSRDESVSIPPYYLQNALQGWINAHDEFNSGYINKNGSKTRVDIVALSTACNQADTSLRKAFNQAKSIASKYQTALPSREEAEAEAKKRYPASLELQDNSWAYSQTAFMACYDWMKGKGGVK